MNILIIPNKDREISKQSIDDFINAMPGLDIKFEFGPPYSETEFIDEDCDYVVVINENFHPEINFFREAFPIMNQGLCASYAPNIHIIRFGERDQTFNTPKKFKYLSDAPDVCQIIPAHFWEAIYNDRRKNLSGITLGQVLSRLGLGPIGSLSKSEGWLNESDYSLGHVDENYDFYDNKEGRLNIMIIKPFGMPHKTEILEMIIERGFLILESEQRKLSVAEVNSIWGNVFENVLKYQGEIGRSFIEEYTQYMTSLESNIFFTYQCGLMPTREKVLFLRGDHYLGEKSNAGSIRRRFPGRGNLNSFHATISIEETARHRHILGISNKL